LKWLKSISLKTVLTGCVAMIADVELTISQCVEMIFLNVSPHIELCALSAKMIAKTKTMIVVFQHKKVIAIEQFEIGGNTPHQYSADPVMQC
jgi:hypoxanthine-guanine phosphoribosyltransferase